MGRRRIYRYYQDSCNKGINQQPELVVPGEVADARNVWAIEGRLTGRPGYVGLVSLTSTAPRTISPLTDSTYVRDIGGALTTAASFVNVVFNVGDSLYLGFSDSPANFLGMRHDISLSLGLVTRPVGLLEYYNGARWEPMHYSFGGGHDGFSINYWPHLKTDLFRQIDDFPNQLLPIGSHRFLSFVVPPDWQQTIVDGNSRYWLRFKILGASATLTAGVNTTSAHEIIGRAPVQWAFGVRGTRAASLLTGQFDGRTAYIRKLAHPDGSGVGWVETDEVGRQPDPDTAASYAFVQETETLYVAQGGTTIAVPLTIEHGSQEFDARVEDDETIIGPRAPYSRDYIVQLTGYPEASRIHWSNSRMWVAYKNRLRWSEPYPYHRVFPSFNTAIVGEDDMSDITALASLGEHVVVFKRNSIYLATAAGQTAFGTRQYAIIRVVSGIGCVAEGSIQKVRGRLVFLGQDGVYIFDGTPNVRKATLGRPMRDMAPGDRLINYMRNLNWGHAYHAQSAHMRRWHCYLLAVPYDESQVNNEVLVWDYDHDAWWIWDNIEAEHFIEGELFGQADTLFFVNDRSQTFALGHANYDHYQTISSSVTTREISLRGHMRYRMRLVELLADAESKEITVEVRRHEDDVNTSSGPLDMTDSTEPTWEGDLVDGETQWAQGGRRYARLAFRVDGDQFNVKLSHSAAGQRFTLSSIKAGMLPFENRR